MTILFMGGEMGAFVPSDNNVFEDTNSTYYDSTFSRAAIHMSGSAAYCESADFTSSNEIWVHFAIRDGSGSGTASATKVLSVTAGGTEMVRVTVDSTTTPNTVSLQYWNGATYTTVASVTVSFNTVQHMDLHIVGNSATGSLTLYVAGTERYASGSTDLSSVTNMTNVRSYGRGAVSDMAVSQVVVADESTIGWRLATIYPNGAGATTDWTGTYTEIDEAVTNDADFINSSTNDQVELVTGSTPTLTGYTVRAVAISARVKRGSTGPANLRFALRSSGTTYDNGSDIALGLGYEAQEAIWETNPATAAAWVNTAISALQYGVKART